MAKILVVDDEADLEMLIVQKFRKQIKSDEYEFVFAHDGKDALDKIKSEENVDMVLTDINMPRMDGLTLLNHLKEEVPMVKSVIVSAYGDMDNIRTAMNRGAFDFITKPIDFNDLSITVEKTLVYVEQMRSTLEAIQENSILKMYVDESVLNFMNTKDYEQNIQSNESIEATVAFIDICSFTSFTEKANADEVVNLLNEYFDIMVNEIIDHEGYVDKFIGDAIMAVFKGDGHLSKALQSAIIIKDRIRQLPPHDSFEPAISVGIASGEMISGNIGAASLRRLDFTVIGDVVNTASRLQDRALPHQVIIPESCYVKVKDSFDCKEIAELKLKNKENKIKMYNVIAYKPKL